MIEMENLGKEEAALAREAGVELDAAMAAIAAFRRTGAEAAMVAAVVGLSHVNKIARQMKGGTGDALRGIVARERQGLLLLRPFVGRGAMGEG